MPQRTKPPADPQKRFWFLLSPTCRTRKLTQFALRLVFTGHTDTPRENDPDLLAQAAAVFEPPAPKACNSRAKEPAKPKSVGRNGTGKRGLRKRRQHDRGGKRPRTRPGPLSCLSLSQSTGDAQALSGLAQVSLRVGYRMITAGYVRTVREQLRELRPHLSLARGRLLDRR